MNYMYATILITAIQSYKSYEKQSLESRQSLKRTPRLLKTIEATRNCYTKAAVLEKY